MQGLFQLKTASDWRAKLRRDLDRLKTNPLDPDAAFNFFVTAEHMLDWVFPGKSNETKRTAERDGSVLLQVCSHIANGGKHFETEAKRHKSVSSTGRRRGGWFGSNWFASNWFASNWFGPTPRLVVALQGDAAKGLGASMEVVDLANQVMAYWDAHPLK